MRIALAHDWICGLRGGEMVLEQIAALVARGSTSPRGCSSCLMMGTVWRPTVDSLPHTVSRVGRWPWASRFRRWLLPMYPRAVDELSGLLDREHQRQPIDLLISTSSAAIKGLRPPEGVPHLCYCHSPARYVWSQGQEYAGGLRGLGLHLWREPFRAWDRASAANVTRFIANSQHTAREIARCYQRDSTVVYPAMRPMFVDLAPAAAQDATKPWLVVSALEPYKRVDLAIASANKMGKELVVLGSGSQRAKLAKLSGPTVRLLGRVNDAELMEWYGKARLLIFPQIEDFGLVAVEAQACGIPVVARRDGGSLETVVEGVTGRFFGEADVDSLLAAIAACPDNCAEACRENAARFSPEKFDEALRAEIDAVMQTVVS